MLNKIKTEKISYHPSSPHIFQNNDLSEHELYFTDESRKQGHADALAFPEKTAEVSQLVHIAKQQRWPITVSGARTGITAGAVPDRGLVISTERMNSILGLRRLADDNLAIKCQAGVVLSELQNSLAEKSFPDHSANWTQESCNALESLKRQQFFFPPDPTEASASIGGITSCNASGSHSFAYGPVRPYVLSLTLVLANGEILHIERGQCIADSNGVFRLQDSNSTETKIHVPSYNQPQAKNVGGYYSKPDMDLVDLFVGSEGTLGIITEVELRLIPAPEKESSAVIFFHSECHALDFTYAVRNKKEKLGLQAIEYLGPHALQFMRKLRGLFGTSSGVPECLPANADAAIYVGHAVSGTNECRVLKQLAEIARLNGADSDICWSASSKDERERLRTFRHALPEAVNNRIAEIRRTNPEITKLGTDMAVPDEQLNNIMEIYREKLDESGLEYLIFGHIGENHLHINIIPRSLEQYNKGKEIYWQLAQKVVEIGGSPIAEHGTGKLKKDFLVLLYGEHGIAKMQRLKLELDPYNRLEPGTLLP